MNSYEDKLVKDIKESKDDSYDHEVNGFKIKTLNSFPPNSNPYHYDLLNMGVSIGDNLEIMHGTYHDNCEFIILVNKITGARIKILL